MKTLIFYKWFLLIINYLDDLVLSAFTTGVIGESILTLSGGELTGNEGEITGNNLYDLILKLLAPIISGVFVVQLNKYLDKKRRSKK
jgi:hypothetical protein